MPASAAYTTTRSACARASGCARRRWAAAPPAFPPALLRVHLLDGGALPVKVRAARATGGKSRPDPLLPREAPASQLQEPRSPSRRRTVGCAGRLVGWRHRHLSAPRRRRRAGQLWVFLRVILSWDVLGCLPRFSKFIMKGRCLIGLPLHSALRSAVQRTLGARTKRREGARARGRGFCGLRRCARTVGSWMMDYWLLPP